MPREEDEDVPARPARRFLGLRLSAELSRLLVAIVEDEKRKAGSFARVTGSSVVFGLIRQEAARRGLT